jgi:hypothetical protein
MSEVSISAEVHLVPIPKMEGHYIISKSNQNLICPFRPMMESQALAGLEVRKEFKEAVCTTLCAKALIQSTKEGLPIFVQTCGSPSVHPISQKKEEKKEETIIRSI